MPRKRNPENKGLPARWKFQHNAYYYRVPPGMEASWGGKKMYRLGSNLAEAYEHWAERIKRPIVVKTIGELLDRYLLEVVPAKASPLTRAANQLAITRLRVVFDDTPIEGFKPRYVYTYVDRRTDKKAAKNQIVRKATVTAHREIEVLSHAFTKAVGWGYLDRHPFKGEVRLEGEKPRTRYVEDWELIEFLSLPSRRKAGSALAVQAYVRIKMLTGMSQGDLLRLSPAKHFTDEGILVQRHKTAGTTGRRTIYEWTPELRSAIELAKDVRPIHIAPWLFCTRRGQPYINEETGQAWGWRSMWQRYMKRALAETELKERFTEHDLRAKVASDAESLERARALLSHADVRMTQRAYRRRPERVKPTR